MKLNNVKKSVLFSCTIAFIVGFVAAPATADIYTLTALLTGGDAVPPVSTSATGLATMVIEEGSSAGVWWSVQFSGLSSAQTGAGFYDGNPGTVGSLWFPVPLGSPQVGTVIPDLGHLAVISQIIFGGSQALYVNISTAAHPSGEIRGHFQLTTTVDEDFKSWGDIKALFR